MELLIKVANIIPTNITYLHVLTNIERHYGISFIQNALLSKNTTTVY